MATPVVKFNHAGNGIAFYLIWDTYYEEPLTVPMDLCTFIQYHMASRRTLTGFIFSWNNIQQNGVSLQGTDCEEYMSEDEKQLLPKLIDDVFGVERADANKVVNEHLTELFENFNIDEHTGEEELKDIEKDVFSHMENTGPLNIPNYRNFWSHSKTYDSLHRIDWELLGIDEIKNKLYPYLPNYHELNEQELVDYATAFNTLYFKGVMDWYEIPQHFRRKFQFTRNAVCQITNVQDQSPFHRCFENCRITTIDISRGRMQEFLISMAMSDFGISKEIHKAIKGENLDTWEEVDFYSVINEQHIQADVFHNIVDPNGNELLPNIYTNVLDQRGGLIILTRYMEGIYELLTLQGDLVDGPAHDIGFTEDGKYEYREARAGGSHLFWEKEFVQNNLFEKDVYGIRDCQIDP